MTVWVLQESIIPGSAGVPMDYSSAERFGDVQFVLNGDPSRQSNSPINERIFDDLSKMAQLYRDDDFLVLTGAPMTIFMAGAALARAGKIPTLLSWNKRHQEYQKVRLPGAVTAGEHA